MEFIRGDGSVLWVLVSNLGVKEKRREKIERAVTLVML